jgi:DNA-binding MarR family transcriptional regulator
LRTATAGDDIISQPNYQSSYLSVTLDIIGDVTRTDQAPEVIAESRMAGYTAYLARLAAQRAETAIDAALPPGRTQRDLAVLCVLTDGPVSQAQLGAALEVNRTVMISVIDELEASGLVRRERDTTDRRRYALRITGTGAAARDQMLPAVRAAERSVTAGLDGAGLLRLKELLGRIIPELTSQLPDSVTAQAGFLLEHVTRRLRREREDAMRGLGLEPRCVGMLVALDSAQPCTQERLAARMRVTGPTIVQAIDDLHASGLIHRDRNPADRREHVLRLTSSGDEYLAEALKAEDAAQRDLADRIGAPEVTELNDLLVAVVAR